MKKYIFYPGCLMQTEQYGYELSLRRLLAELDVEIVDLDNFSCCGAPFRSVNRLITLYLCVRNLAIASETGYPVIMPCPQCHLAFKEAMRDLKESTVVEKVNKFLAEENLRFHNNLKVIHPVELLYDEIGISNLEKFVKKRLQINIAVHYGCQLIRPSRLGRADDSELPYKIDKLVELTGAKSVDYAEKLACCGGTVFSHLPDAALTKTGQKIAAVQKYNVDCIVDACPWCHRMLDSKQENAAKTMGVELKMPVLYFTQLLCIAIGLDEKIGLELNLSPMEKLKV